MFGFLVSNQVSNKTTLLNVATTAPPRPLPSAVLAEFDRQRENAARFRRKSTHGTEDNSTAAALLQAGGKDHEFHPFPEVATFTLFFMTFTSLVGKELIVVADNPSYSEDHTIFSSVFFNEKSKAAAEIFRSTEKSPKQVTDEKTSELGASAIHETHGIKTVVHDDERSAESLDEFKELDTSSNGSNEAMKIADANKHSSAPQDDCEKAIDHTRSEHLLPVTNGMAGDTEDVVCMVKHIKEMAGEAIDPSVNESKEAAILSHHTVEASATEEGGSFHDPDEDKCTSLIIEEESGDGENKPKAITSTLHVSENGIVSKNRTEQKIHESQDDLSPNNVSIVSESDSNDGEVNDQNFSSTDTHDQASIHDTSFSAGSNEEGKSQGGSRKMVMPRILKEVSTRSLQSLKTLSKSLVSPSLPTQVEQSRPSRSKSALDVRSRFTDKLSVLELEEAKATAKAQIGMAFEILQMMRERGLKADPSVYQCLIEACGRCGDTEHATLLLSRMHDDGIVADGVVYACLVSAFSAENAWKKKIGKTNEHLPGEKWLHDVMYPCLLCLVF